MPEGVTISSVAGDARGTVCCFLVIGAASLSGGVYLVLQVDTIKGFCLATFGVVVLLTPCFAICFAYSKSSDIARFTKRLANGRNANGTVPLTRHPSVASPAAIPMRQARSVSVACIYRDGLAESNS